MTEQRARPHTYEYIRNGRVNRIKYNRLNRDNRELKQQFLLDIQQMEPQLSEIPNISAKYRYYREHVERPVSFSTFYKYQKMMRSPPQGTHQEN
jgi:hypothetical protein